ncbi:hypothetical protein B0I35DRAFT_418301 [Stachybotrys elegans]|uniref:Secreted protein n=1 Tax=Stachybotrys elegans TaxID=80388 RepID=A0A8K0T7I0_9HYPO|nr:hypothetical protein B0I35DRAFT_418301 [Stachybotrys elegans]
MQFMPPILRPLALSWPCLCLLPPGGEMLLRYTACLSPAFACWERRKVRFEVSDPNYKDSIQNRKTNTTSCLPTTYYLHI